MLRVSVTSSGMECLYRRSDMVEVCREGGQLHFFGGRNFARGGTPGGSGGLVWFGGRERRHDGEAYTCAPRTQAPDKVWTAAFVFP